MIKVYNDDMYGLMALSITCTNRQTILTGQLTLYWLSYLNPVPPRASQIRSRLFVDSFSVVQLRVTHNVRRIGLNTETS